jgi:hypothetical protein
VEPGRMCRRVRLAGWCLLALHLQETTNQQSALVRRAVMAAVHAGHKGRPAAHPPYRLRLTASPTHFLNAANSSAHIPFSTSVYLAPIHLPYAAPYGLSGREGER